MNNLKILGSIIHALFSEVIYDIFEEVLIQKKVLSSDLKNKDEILH